MLRVPSARLDPKTLQQYFAVRTSRDRSSRSVATVTAAGKHLVLDLWSESESGDAWADIDENG